MSEAGLTTHQRFPGIGTLRYRYSKTIQQMSLEWHSRLMASSSRHRCTEASGSGIRQREPVAALQDPFKRGGSSLLACRDMPLRTPLQGVLTSDNT
jgi:hypothetical protein